MLKSTYKGADIKDILEYSMVSYYPTMTCCAKIFDVAHALCLLFDRIKRKASFRIYDLNYRYQSTQGQQRYCKLSYFYYSALRPLPLVVGLLSTIGESIRLCFDQKRPILPCSLCTSRCICYFRKVFFKYQVCKIICKDLIFSLC